MESENFVEIKVVGDCSIGNSLSVSFDIKKTETLKKQNLNPERIKKDCKLQTEWIVVDPKTKKVLKVVNGESFLLDEEIFLKNLKVHSIPIIKDY